MSKLAVLGTVLLSLTAALSAQQNDLIHVSIRGSSGSRASLTASAQPYFESGPVAKVWLPSGTNVQTRNGRPIVGFEFTAWTEGDATRGQVFVLVPASGSPNADFRYRPDLLERSEFASYRLRPGENVPITEMRSLGLEPMMVQAESLREIAARLERMMESLQKK